MESQSETAVSLDELTLDIAFDSPNESIATFDIQEHQKDEETQHLTPHVDDNFQKNINDDSGLPNEEEEASLDVEGESVLTGRDINIEMSLKDPNQDSSQSKPAHETDPSDQELDFEADAPPLSLFPSRRDEDNDDDDDFDFDFPDPKSSSDELKNTAHAPALLLFPKKQDNDDDFEFDFPDPSIKIKTTVNDVTEKEKDSQLDVKTVQFSEQTYNLPPIEKISTDIDNLEPELLTPRDKTTSGLSSMSILQNIAQNEYNATMASKSQDNNKSLNILDEPKLEEEEEVKDHPKPSIVSTAEDWDNVQVVVPGFVEEGKSRKDAIPAIESKPLAKFSETLSELSSLNYDNVKDQIITKVDRRGLSAITHLLFGPPKINKDLVGDRDLLFYFAATKFDDDNFVHNRMLQTIYRCLTGSKFDCQRYGSHWEEIGFQGQDPSTDLRGAGVLSLLHILYFLQDPSTKDLARDIYKLSLHPTQNFPFCVMGINITVMCLKVVREEVYNREFNRRKDVIGPFNNLYAALYLRLYQLWKKGKTIHDSGYLLEEVSSYSRKNAKNIFKDLETYEKNRRDQNVFGDQPPGGASFLNVCKEEKCDGKTVAELY